MRNTFYSPEGNPEIWNEKPEGYFTPEEWETGQAPTPEELAARRIAQIRARPAELENEAALRAELQALLPISG